MTSAPYHCRLLLADDHVLLRHGLASLLGMAGDMQVVCEVGNGLDAVAQWQALRPDVVLIDIRMPGLDGLSAAERILAIDPKAGVVVLSTYDGEDDIYRAVRAGVRGYLLKMYRPTSCWRACARCARAAPTCRCISRRSSPAACASKTSPSGSCKCWDRWPKASRTS